MYLRFYVLQLRNRNQRKTRFPQLDSPGEHHFLGIDVAGFVISFLPVRMCMTKTMETDEAAVTAERLDKRKGLLHVAAILPIENNFISSTKTEKK